MPTVPPPKRAVGITFAITVPLPSRFGPNMILATGLRRHRSCSSPGTERNSASPEKLTPHPPQRKSRPRKLLRLRKPPTPRPKKPPKSRRNTTEPEPRPRNDRNTSGDFAGNEVKPQRKVDSASTAQNLLSQIRPGAKPALRTTGNPAGAARKRRRLQIRPHSRPLRNRPFGGAEHS